MVALQLCDHKPTSIINIDITGRTDRPRRIHFESTGICITSSTQGFGFLLHAFREMGLFAFAFCFSRGPFVIFLACINNCIADCLKVVTIPRLLQCFLRFGMILYSVPRFPVAWASEWMDG